MTRNKNYTLDATVFGMTIATNLIAINTLIEAVRLAAKVAQDHEHLVECERNLDALEITKLDILSRLN